MKKEKKETKKKSKKTLLKKRKPLSVYSHKKLNRDIKFEFPESLMEEKYPDKSAVFVIMKKVRTNEYVPIDLDETDNLHDTMKSNRIDPNWIKEIKAHSDDRYKNYVFREKKSSIPDNQIYSKERYLSRGFNIISTPYRCYFRLYEKEDIAKRMEFKAYLQELFNPFELIEDRRGYLITRDDNLLINNPYFSVATNLFNNVVIQHVAIEKQERKVKQLFLSNTNQKDDNKKVEFLKIIERLAKIGSDKYLEKYLIKYRFTKGYPDIKSTYPLEIYLLADLLEYYALPTALSFYSKNPESIGHLILLTSSLYQVRELELNSYGGVSTHLESSLSFEQSENLHKFLITKNFIKKTPFDNFNNIFSENLTSITPIKWKKNMGYLYHLFSTLKNLNLIQCTYFLKIIESYSLFLNSRGNKVTSKNLSQGSREIKDKYKAPFTDEISLILNTPFYKKP